jgi:methyltransferase
LREKTIRVGFLFRAMAIFRVERMIIFHEDPSNPSRNALLIKLLCEYMSAAPYLRRILFRLRPELRYAGLLPPLNVPIHPESPLPPKDGWELRDGLVRKRGGLAVIHAGLKRDMALESSLRDGARVIVMARMVGEKIRVKVRSARRVPYYTVTEVQVYEGPLSGLVQRYSYSIATDRKGTLFPEVASKLKHDLQALKSPICVAFGSYKRGLNEIAALQGVPFESLFTVCVNFIPEQGVRSVRTEEAVYAVLATLNNLTAL